MLGFLLYVKGSSLLKGFWSLQVGIGAVYTPCSVCKNKEKPRDVWNRYTCGWPAPLFCGERKLRQVLAHEKWRNAP